VYEPGSAVVRLEYFELRAQALGNKGGTMVLWFCSIEFGYFHEYATRYIARPP
jgi:hypothetical protein